jgi:hypothetical protein
MPTGEPAGSSLNVGLFGRSIKGKLVRRSIITNVATQSCNKVEAGAVLTCPPDELRSSLLEQLVRGIAMARGIREMLFDPGYFALQGVNPFIKLIDREGAEVLLDEQGQGILRLAGKEVILVHAVQS